MARIYVRSTDGSDSDNGSTWALAKASMDDVDGASSIDSAGDSIFLSQSHNESTAAAVTITLANTLGTPVKVICANDGAGDASNDPTTLATTAVVETTNGDLSIEGSCYVYGIEFRSGNGGNVAGDMQFGAGGATDNFHMVFEKCLFNIASTNGSQRIRIPSPGWSVEPQLYEFRQCNFQFSNATQCFAILPGEFIWEGGSIISDAAITTLFDVDNSNGRGGGVIRVSGVDLSNCASTVSLITSAPDGPVHAHFINCKLPSGWSGSLTSPAESGSRYEMHNCDSGDTNYKIWIADYKGTIRDHTSIYLDGGVTDGTTSLSYVMASAANCGKHGTRFYSPEFHVWNDTTGSSKTATVQIVHDGASALKDNEIWLEISYLGTSGFPLGTWKVGKYDGTAVDALDVLATGTAQATSSETWTGDTGTGPNGSSTWNQLKLTCAFTPQEKGVLVARVVMGVASKTIYVDPNVIIT